MSCQFCCKVVSVSLVMGVFLGLLPVAHRAQAGGFENSWVETSSNQSPFSGEADFSHSELADPSTRNLTSERHSSRSTLDWRNWSEPYADGDIICRESTINLVCLTPTSAEYFHW